MPGFTHAENSVTSSSLQLGKIKCSWTLEALESLKYDSNCPPQLSTIASPIVEAAKENTVFP